MTGNSCPCFGILLAFCQFPYQHLLFVNSYVAYLFISLWPASTSHQQFITGSANLPVPHPPGPASGSVAIPQPRLVVYMQLCIQAVELRSTGREPYAYRFVRTHMAAELQRRFQDLPAGEVADLQVLCA